MKQHWWQHFRRPNEDKSMTMLTKTIGSLNNELPTIHFQYFII